MSIKHDDGRAGFDVTPGQRVGSLRIHNVDITKRIRALLALRGETTMDLAESIGVSQPTLSYRLTGRRNFEGLCTVERIAVALGVPVSTLELGAPWPDVSSVEWRERLESTDEP